MCSWPDFTTAADVTRRPALRRLIAEFTDMAFTAFVGIKMGLRQRDLCLIDLLFYRQKEPNLFAHST